MHGPNVGCKNKLQITYGILFDQITFEEDFVIRYGIPIMA